MGRALPVGTKSMHGGVLKEKQADGSWRTVRTSKEASFASKENKRVGVQNIGNSAKAEPQLKLGRKFEQAYRDKLTNSKGNKERAGRGYDAMRKHLFENTHRDWKAARIKEERARIESGDILQRAIGAIRLVEFRKKK